MKRDRKEIIKVLMPIGCVLLGILILIVLWMLLALEGRAEEVISGREGCQWLVEVSGSSGDLMDVSRAGCDIKGVNRMCCTLVSMPVYVTPGICVCRSSHADLTALSDLLTSRGSIGSYSRFYRAERLPSTGRRVRGIEPLRLDKDKRFL